MRMRSIGRVALFAAFLAIAVLSGNAAAEASDVEANTTVVAQAHGTEQGELDPRYQPVPPEQKSWYNAGYFFALTRSVAGSTLVPAAKAPLFLLTAPLDLVLLPFAAIGGLFG